ncbi:Na(+)/H(+) exchange regulatory cofactor NHE-RF1-like [Centruroides sculpturatus]|uniref:Na(+)/H(+) exchange regulatory cofactor NHE-RF1-like n=1 Tax=Centruroides sculpturatus TaxID=218467 RepID=UPI000C6CD5B5|nr:Na(+)/H(+) exchange regulatory cofactor NHE-RF1-like [Centruroides sculpturatus]
MSAVELPPDAPAPRLCHLIKWPDFDGYGFNLHAEKSKPGQYVGKVDEGSPADLSGLKEGDRIIEVNGVNINNENHRQVVERIKAVPNETKLLVLEVESDKWYKDRKIVVKSTQSNVIYRKTPFPRPDSNIKQEAQVRKDSPVPTTNSSNIKQSSAVVHESPVENARYNGESSTSAGSPSPQTSSRSSTPQTLPKSDVSNEVDSLPASPHSSKSSHSQNGANGPIGPKNSATDELNLNMSVSEMRQLLASRKKRDPKKIQMDLRHKYDIIQQM